jgi:hypothetical protein
MSILLSLYRTQSSVFAIGKHIMSANAAGLKPKESRALKERSMLSHEQSVITALKEVNMRG